jgi:glucokinase
MVTVGTGISCGLILNGELYRGANGASGEIGYMLTDADTVERWDAPIYAGSGFLESKVGGPAILREYCRRSGLTKPGKGKQTAKDIFDAFREGDLKAVEVILEASRHLAAGIVNLVSLFDPEVVIFGGGLFGSADILMPAIERTVHKLTPMRPEFRLSRLGDLAAAVGGAALVLKEHSVFQGVL